jgi:hypothetical protein
MRGRAAVGDPHPPSVHAGGEVGGRQCMPEVKQGAASPPLYATRPTSFAFDERGSAVLHCLSPRSKIASPVCVLCWRHCLASTVVHGEAKMLLSSLLGSSLRCFKSRRIKNLFLHFKLRKASFSEAKAARKHGEKG